MLFYNTATVLQSHTCLLADSITVIVLKHPMLEKLNTLSSSNEIGKRDMLLSVCLLSTQAFHKQFIKRVLCVPG